MLVSPTSKNVAPNQPSAQKVSLTELDRAILEQLSHDPLTSNRAIAEALGVSTGQVAARTRWLDQKNVSRVIAVLDLKAAGQSFCFVQVDVRGRSISDVAADVSSIRETLAVSALIGSTHDLLVLLRFTTPDVLHNLLFRSLAQIEGVYRISVAIVLEIPVFRAQYVTYMPHFLPLDVRANIRELAIDYADNIIDATDRCIIAELQQDGRKSINDIARRYKLNSGTIRYRVKNLESKGLLRFITVFDPSVIAIKEFALLEIEVAANHIESVIRHLNEKSFLRQVFLCAGTAAIVSILEADTIETIQRIKNEELTPIEGVIEVRATLITHTYKMDMRWGQRFTSRADG
jgi:DNA-binding Lrp family transcriptional regulator